MKTFNQEELNQLLEYWKKELQLFDWEISVSISRHFDMFQPETSGGVTWNIRRKRASIKILDQFDYSIKEFEFDQEQTLVHELLHVKFAIIDNYEKTEEDIYEQIIDSLAVTLVKLKRGNVQEVKYVN
jgi:hypothetical protein